MSEISLRDKIERANVTELIEFGRKFGIETHNNSYTSFKEKVHYLCATNKKAAKAFLNVRYC